MDYPDDETLRSNLNPKNCEEPPDWKQTFFWFHRYSQRWDPAQFLDTIASFCGGWPEHRPCGPRCYYRDVSTVASLAVSLNSGLHRAGIEDDRKRALLVLQAIEFADLGHYGASATLGALRYQLETDDWLADDDWDPLDHLVPFDSSATDSHAPERSDEWRQLNDDDLPTLPGG